LVVLAVFLALSLAACPAPSIPSAAYLSGYCGWIWSTNVSLPRGIITADNGDVIVVESGIGQVSIFYEGTAGKWVKATLAAAPQLNHAVIIHEGYLYASSPSTVYRWPYKAGIRTNLGTPQTVVTGIPTTHHTTRSLIFDASGNLLVQVGSGSNVDPDASRAGIRKFDLSTIPQTFTNGPWFVQGLRNEVGLRADAKGNLWGVENGMDDLTRPDLGGDIHQGNPSEELNLFAGQGEFYGYPYCFSQYNLTTVTTPRGTQYAVPPFLSDGTHTDKWCQNASNVIAPAYSLHPHTAPLDLLFYYGSSFPGLAGNLFVTQHGSWDSDPPVGYRIVLVRFDATGKPVSDEPFFYYSGNGQTGTGWLRPVALTLIKDSTGADILLLTSDETNSILAIQHSGTTETEKIQIVN